MLGGFIILKAKYKIFNPLHVKLGAEFIYFKEVRLVSWKIRTNLRMSLAQGTEQNAKLAWVSLEHKE